MMHGMHPRNRDPSDGLAASACPRRRWCGRRDALQLRRRRRRRRRRRHGPVANEMGRVVDTVLIVRGKAAGMVSFSGDPIVVWMVHVALSESLFQC